MGMHLMMVYSKKLGVGGLIKSLDASHQVLSESGDREGEPPKSFG